MLRVLYYTIYYIIYIIPVKSYPVKCRIKKIRNKRAWAMNFSGALSTCNGVIQVFLKINYVQLSNRLLSTTEEPREKNPKKRHW